MKYAFSDSSFFSNPNATVAVLAEDTFLGHDPIFESTQINHVDSILPNVSQFDPIYESSRLPTPVHDHTIQIDETVYYDTTAHMPFPYAGACHAAPWGVNQLEFSADFTVGGMQVPLQYYPPEQQPPDIATTTSEPYGTPVPAPRVVPYEYNNQTPWMPNTGTQLYGQKNSSCNHSPNSSGYGSEGSYTPDQTYVPDQSYPELSNMDNSIACKLDWTVLAETSMVDEEMSEEMDEILSILQQHEYDGSLGGHVPPPIGHVISIDNGKKKRRKKRRCTSPELGENARKVRKVNKEPRRYATTTITVLSTWLRGNMKNPYPSEMEKKEFVRKTGLNREQIRQWFVNARRRYAREGRRPVQTTR